MKDKIKILHQMKLMNLKPQDSFGRCFKVFLDLQKVDYTIRKHQ